MIDGRPISQVRKQPAPGEIRVHEQYGGATYPSTLTEEAASIAADAVAASAAILDADLVYARIDLMRHDGVLMVSEVEVTEPGLYLDVLPDNAEPFAEAARPPASEFGLASARPSRSGCALTPLFALDLPEC